VALRLITTVLDEPFRKGHIFPLRGKKCWLDEELRSWK
jgi:hypothetical protein